MAARWPMFLPVIGFATIALVFGLGLTKNPQILPSMLLDRALPPLHVPPLLEGATALTNADFKGEPMLLNVYASWCAACPIEHPRLMQIAREKSVPLLGLDWKDKVEDGRLYLARSGNPYAKIGSDVKGRAGIDLGVSGVPETFVIDGHGKVRYRHVGPISDDDWHDLLLPMIKKLRTEA